MLPESPARRRTVLAITCAVRDDLGRSGYLRRTLAALRPSAGGRGEAVADPRSRAISLKIVVRVHPKFGRKFDHKKTS